MAVGYGSIWHHLSWPVNRHFPPVHRCSCSRLTDISFEQATALFLHLYLYIIDDQQRTTRHELLRSQQRSHYENPRRGVLLARSEYFLLDPDIKAPYQDLSKDLVYSNDVRNVHFEMKLTCSDGLNESEEKFLFDKDTMNSFFQQI